MNRIRCAQGIVALALMCSASPAMASDFSGLFYAFIAAAVAVALVAAFIVWILRRLAKGAGPWIDVVSAILLAACLAPTTFIDSLGSDGFSLLPAWLIALMVDDWTDLLPASAISFLVTAGLLYLLFRSLRQSNHQNAPDEVE